MTLVDLVVLLLVIIGICWFTKWIVGYMGVPHPANVVILVAVCLVCLLVLVDAVGVLSGPVIRIPRLGR